MNYFILFHWTKSTRRKKILPMAMIISRMPVRIQLRKNIVNLFRAFESFKEKLSSEVKLVIVGRNWNYTEAMKVLGTMKFKDDVIFHGHMSRKELSRLMEVRCAWCMPPSSRDSGFRLWKQ